MLSMAALLSLLSGCGGGGSMSDGLTPLAMSPSEIKEVTADKTCPATAGAVVYMAGGTLPLTLRNPAPDRIALSTTYVTRFDQGVSIDFKGGCLDNLPVTVIDSAGLSAFISVSYVAQGS